MLKYRLITALVLIPLVIAALFLLPLMGFALVTLAICVLAAWEWGAFAGFSSPMQRTGVAAGGAIVLVLSLYGISQTAAPAIALPSVRLVLWLALLWWGAALLLVLFYPSSAASWRQSRFLRLLFGLLTLLPFFFGMLVLREQGSVAEPHAGAWWLLYVMLLVWGADSGAYMFGKLFGRHKLAPKVSPGKTLEGLLGGLLTSALISLLFSYFVSLQVPPLTLLFCSVITVLASVLGDLTESMFKREAGIKDSGSLIPGHGGVLDRIDSLTAAIPVFACLMLLMF